MTNLGKILEGPLLLHGGSVLADVGHEREVDGVSLVERPRSSPSDASGRILVLTASASRSLANHQLDILLRWATHNSAVAIVVTEHAVPRGLPATARQIASRGRISVLSLSSEVDVGTFLLSLHDALADGGSPILNAAATRSSHSKGIDSGPIQLARRRNWLHERWASQSPRGSQARAGPAASK
jgi:hypothetical protein